MLGLVQVRGDQILVVIRITIWIQNKIEGSTFTIAVQEKASPNRIYGAATWLTQHNGNKKPCCR